jgi:hypothetical protein
MTKKDTPSDAPSPSIAAATNSTTLIAGPYHILSPPIKKSMIHGHLVPTFRSATAVSMLQQPHRRLTIELSSTTPCKNENEELTELQDNDRVLLRIFRLSSDMSSSPRAAEETVTSPFESSGNNWVEHKVYRLDEIEILKQIVKKDCVEVQLGLGNDTIVRDFRFVVPGAPPEPGMLHFCQTIERMKVLEQKRAQRQLDQYTLESPLPQSAAEGMDTAATTTGAASSHRIQILVEIVSATNLPVADLVATDAYVVVRFGTKEVHRTAVISNNLSPIFTLPTGSLFLLSYTPEEFFKQGTSGLSFTIKDYDSVGSNDVLGTVHVTLQELLKGTGQRMPYPIVLDLATIKAGKKEVPLLKNDDEKKSVSDSLLDNKILSPVKAITGTKNEKESAIEKKKPPMLYLRYRAATEKDVQFMKEYQELQSKSSSPSYGIYASETFLSIRAMPYPKGHLLQRQEKKNQQKEVLVRLYCPWLSLKHVMWKSFIYMSLARFISLTFVLSCVVSSAPLSRSGSSRYGNGVDD